MAVAVKLKSKMVSKMTKMASSARSGGNGKSTVFKAQKVQNSNKSPKTLLDGPATPEHMSELPPFKFEEI